MKNNEPLVYLKTQTFNLKLLNSCVEHFQILVRPVEHLITTRERPTLTSTSHLHFVGHKHSVHLTTEKVKIYILYIVKTKELRKLIEVRKRIAATPGKK